MTPDVSKSDLMQLLADGLALVYHEARNARFLIEAKVLPAAGWEALTSLDTDTNIAWRQVEPLRKAAAAAPFAAYAVATFEERFTRTPQDLVELFAIRYWSSLRGWGGHHWSDTTRRVIELRAALEEQNDAAAREAMRGLVCSRHRSGVLRERLNRLDVRAKIPTNVWWRVPLPAAEAPRPD